MARTKKLPKNSISEPIQMIHQRLMRHGKKRLAMRIFQKSLNHIKNQTKQDPFLIIENGIRNTTPSVEIRMRRGRGRGRAGARAIELSLDRGVSRAIRWILSAAKKRSGPAERALAQEFIDASKKKGAAFYKKEEIQKLLET